jgi:hypothetical protein
MRGGTETLEHLDSVQVSRTVMTIDPSRSNKSSRASTVAIAAFSFRRWNTDKYWTILKVTREAMARVASTDRVSLALRRWRRLVRLERADGLTRHSRSGVR